MPSVDIENIKIKRLAQRLMDDIHRRGLRPGDRYMTASKASDQLEATEISVHRAMQHLADREILVRQRGSGTFIGSGFEPRGPATSPLQVVHVVMAMDYQRTATVPAETLVDRLSHALSGAVVEVHYVTPHDAMRHLNLIVDRMGRAPERADAPREGIILIRSTRKMQLYVAESSLPAVVFGSVYPGVSGLSWLDGNQLQAGQLMGDYLLEQPEGRTLLLMRDDWRHGDNMMVRGLTESLGRGGVSLGDVQILSIPPDPHHIAGQVHELLHSDPGLTRIACRRDLYADAVADVVDGLGRKRARSVAIVAGGGRRPKLSRYAYVRPEIDEDEQVEAVGHLLAERAGEAQTVQHRVVPVSLVRPTNTSRRRGQSAS